MKNIPLMILLIAISGTSLAAETPAQFMKRYVGYFNDEDLERYQTTFEFPVISSKGGVLEVFADPEVPMANFDNIKKTGWVRSRIDSINVLSESSAAALVEFSFSRMNSQGSPFFQSTGYYGLVSTDDGWKIQSWFFVKPVTVGND